MFIDLPDAAMPLWDAIARLTSALLCGAVIGWEREAKGRAAGLRTHMLVALGAAGFTIVGLEFAEPRGADGRAGDSVKIIEAVAAGVGFLGAGAIMQSGMQVKGLTTAASIWIVAAIGVASGAGLWIFAALMTALALLTLMSLIWLERRGAKHDNPALGPAADPTHTIERERGRDGDAEASTSGTHNTGAPKPTPC